LKRYQKLVVIERNGRYFGRAGNGPEWVDELRFASVWPEKQGKMKADIDIGMPCNLLPVEPKLIGN